ncbi:MAG: hypothetical protein KGY75_10315 [Candidatus Cloacimonetes bacterium]|nr:hypothetical protein [Candidatus Cloacimonadota bacterium]
MKKITIFFILSILFLSANSFALDSSIWYKFPIPEYKYSYSYLEFPDFFDWKIEGEEYHVNLQSNMYYNYFNQKKGNFIQLSGGVRGNWMKYKRIYSDHTERAEYKSLDSYIRFYITKYFDKLNLWASNYTRLITQNNAKPQLDSYNTAGVGIGRIVYCTSVAKAIRLVDEFDLNANVKLVLQIADIIAKKEMYREKYKDTWEEIYYKKLAKLIGFPEKGLKVRRILASHIYVLNTRMKGFELRLGYENSFSINADTQSEGSIIIQGDYGLPWGLNKQITLQSELARDMDDNEYQLIFTGIFGLDLSYTWTNNFKITNSNIFYNDDKSDYNKIILSLETRKNILNRLVSSLEINYQTKTNSNPKYFQTKLRLIYAIL